jgi:hypothetical protein
MTRVERWRALCDERIRLAGAAAARWKRGEPTGAIDQRIMEIAAELEALNVTPKERANADGLDGRAALAQTESRRVDEPEPLNPWDAMRRLERKWRPP